MFKTVIFDFDGVVANSERVHLIAERKVMTHYSWPVSEEQHHSYIGKTEKEMWKDLLRNYKCEEDINDVMELKAKFFLDIIEKENAELIMPGLPELLFDLKKKGANVCIASSGRKDLIDLMLEKTGIRNNFEFIITADDVDRGKPAPDLFLKAADNFNNSSEECIVIEDSENGVRAAISASMPVVGFVNSHSGNQNLSDADYIVSSHNELNYNILKRVCEGIV